MFCLFAFVCLKIKDQFNTNTISDPFLFCRKKRIVKRGLSEQNIKIWAATSRLLLLLLLFQEKKLSVTFSQKIVFRKKKGYFLYRKSDINSFTLFACSRSYFAFLPTEIKKPFERRFSFDYYSIFLDHIKWGRLCLILHFRIGEISLYLRGKKGDPAV